MGVLGGGGRHKMIGVMQIAKRFHLLNGGGGGDGVFYLVLAGWG